MTKTLLLVLALSAVLDAQGINELATSTAVRPVLTGAQAGVPDIRGPFIFAAPYGTQGYRITIPDDCAAGQDCVRYIGYAYWPRMDYHVGSDDLYIMVALRKDRGGGGPTLFRLHKPTKAVTKIGPLFAATDPRSDQSGETWWFSRSTAHRLYVHPTTTSSALQAFDVLTRQTATVLDIAPQAATYGASRYIWQVNSNTADTVFSFTVRSSSTFGMLGCGVYQTAGSVYRYFPSLGIDFDECQIDKSGRWLVIKEQIDGLHGEDNRIIDLTTGAEVRLLDQDGAGGHSDLGYGWMIAADNWLPSYSGKRLWNLETNPLGPGTVQYRAPFGVGGLNHVSFTHATPGDITRQYFCGSDAFSPNGPRANEVVCVRLDGSLRVIAVAPVMTDLSTMSEGGDDYSQMPKGHTDITGQYFIWSTNLGGDFTHVVIAEVPWAVTPAVLPSTPLGLRVHG